MGPEEKVESRRRFLVLGASGIAAAALALKAPELVQGQSAPKSASTVDATEDLRGLSTGDLADGDAVEALGRDSRNDGGGGLFYWDATSAEADDGGVVMAPFPTPARGRWIRVKDDPPSVLWFGAKASGRDADAAQNDAAFQRAISYARATGRRVVRVPKGAGSYKLSAPLTLDSIGLEGEDVSTTLEWAEDLGTGQYAITLMGENTEAYNSAYLENLRVLGGGNTALGSAPRQSHGVRCGTAGNEGFMSLRNVMVDWWNHGVVLDNDTGHVAMYDVVATRNYYGLYVARGNQDYRFDNCAFNGNTFAGIGMPKNSGIDGSTFTRTHIGFQPYGIYQSDALDTRPPLDAGGNPVARSVTFVSSSTFVGVQFEKVGNAAVLSEAVLEAGAESPSIAGNTFMHCFGMWGDDYRIADRPRDWFVSVPFSQENFVDWGNQPWPFGERGIIRSGGQVGGWTWVGKKPSPPTGTVVYSGPKDYNRFIGQEARQVTVAAGATSATYSFDAMEGAMEGAIRPVASPLSNPGSSWWITKDATGVTVNLASAAPADGVTFNLHLAP